MNEAALKERLKTIANEKNTSLNKMWKQLLLERFLARLSNSSYQRNFIFKGGLLLARYLNIFRETVDIDFLLVKTKSEMNNIGGIFKEISAIDCHDGFTFSFFSIEELSQPHMEYNGYRITIDAQFGKMRDKIQVDIGVGDVVEPIEETFSSFEYKGKPIFTGEISLSVYPPEAIFAEKFETILSKGAINSRMKDYHDLIVMIREPDFLDASKLATSVKKTFERRSMKRTLIQFDNHGMRNLQPLWHRHLQGLGVFKDRLNLPENINDVIDEINTWIAVNIAIRTS